MVGLASKYFAVIIIKNVMIRTTDLCSTLICTVVSTFPFLMIALYHYNFGRETDTKWREPEMFPSTGLHSIKRSWFLGYSPKNAFTELLMTETQSYLKKRILKIELIPADDEITMMAALRERGTYEDSKIGVVFDVLPDENFTTNLNYKIRGESLHTPKELFPKSQHPGPMDSARDYLTFEFVGIQKSIDSAFIGLIGRMQGKWSPSYSPHKELHIQYFPYPAYFGLTEYERDSRTLMKYLQKYSTIFALLFIPFTLVHCVLEEKESGVKELMKLRGLNEFILWASWQIYILMVFLLSVSIITGILKHNFLKSGILIPHSHWTILWLFLLLEVISTVSFFYFVTTVFNKPYIALIIGIPLWLFLIHFPLHYNNFSPWKIMLILIIIPMLTIDYGFFLIEQFESQGVGVHWQNVSEKCMEDDCILSMGELFMVLTFSIAFYYVISWYMASVKPGPFGRAKPLYFVFQMLVRSEDADPNLSQNIADEYKDKFEKAPNLKVGISIRKLRKTFNRGHLIAVDNVTMDIYEGLITVLLGQNGAGKTTMMNILTGMFSPTSGKIYYNGKNIFANSKNFRGVVTLCPQHDLLFPNFDCIQHLIIFGMLQGLSCSKARAEGNKLINEFNIANKKHTSAKHLSGGMKRKLSLAIALIGDAKINILDEPTSGLDPESRREVWDILLRCRGERMILITTHFMEEADVLGDRIAIMDHGNVHCYGTPLFLKRIYGSGFNYKLTILKNESKSTAAVTSVVSSAMPGAIVNSQMGTVVMYSLPTALAKNIPALFRNLESEKARLGITGMSIAFTSMEDVFISVSQKTTDDEPSSNKSSAGADLQHPLGERNRYMQISIIAFIIRFKTLMVKRIIHGLRSWFSTFCFLLIVLLSTWLAIHSLNESLVPELNPPLLLQLSIYSPTTVLFMSDSNTKSRIYEDLINHQGSECIRVYDSPHVAYQLMEISEIDIVIYRSQYLVAAQFDDDKHEFTAMFSSIPYHAVPISLNLVTNTLCRAVNSMCSITTSNHPVYVIDNFFLCSGTVEALHLACLTFGTLLGIGLLFQVGQCIAFPLTERMTKVKQLQFMTGVGPWSYWLALFVYDYILHTVTLLLMVVCIFATDIQSIFTYSTDIVVLSLLILLYFASGTWYAYLFSRLPTSNAGGFSVFCLFNVLLSFLTLLIYLIVPFPKAWHKKAVMVICYLSPQCAAYYALENYAIITLTNNRCRLCSSFGIADLCRDHVYKPYFSDDDFYSFRAALISLALDTLLYFSIILLWDSGIFSIFSIGWAVGIQASSNEDSDVIQEQKSITAARAVSGETRKLLIVDSLRKSFCTKIAVHNVGFTAGSGECFGLLGVNGAGKTTTFRMLTGDTTPNRGDAFILNYSLVKQKKKYLAQIGYCPQISGIIDSLTGEEMLTLFANLRGINGSKEVQLHINYWINILGLQEYRKYECGTYSGGNKRKLSTAIALIGDPAVVFLDEPTSGVDPVSRRNLWAALARTQKAGQAIVLTSHSMEECEALCNRLTIMVRGRMKCIGNIQYLKQKYGLGFTIMIKVSTDPALSAGLEKLKQAVVATFGPNTNLKDEHAGLLHYHIADPELSWSKLYGGMEELKSRMLLVEDFSISDTTLEQMFIEFAQQDKRGGARTK